MLESSRPDITVQQTAAVQGVGGPGSSCLATPDVQNKYSEVLDNRLIVRIFLSFYRNAF